jgi:hypothetical protein
VASQGAGPHQPSPNPAGIIAQRSG